MYASVGEKLDELERFHPERMASRILGMGDVMSLIEKAEEVSDQREAKDLERKIRRQEFTLEDFLQQMRQVRRMGPLTNVLGLMPGMGKAMRQLRQVNMDERELDRVEAIILSMTPAERARPDTIDGSRRRRIARGSGTTVQAVNQLVKQFAQMRKLMARLAKGQMPDPQQLMRGM
jgi:signal recognition particle subunit SRP54